MRASDFKLMEHTMNFRNRFAPLLIAASLVMPLAACSSEEETAAPVEQAPVAVPAEGADQQAWNAYLSDVVNRNMQGVRQRPFVYLVRDESDEEFEGRFEGLREKASEDISRGIAPGNMLVYGGPQSANVATLIKEAFEGVQQDTMKGVKVLFVGSAADAPAVREAVATSGVDLVHIDTGR